MPASTIEVFIYEKTYRIFNNEYAKLVPTNPAPTKTTFLFEFINIPP